MTAGGKTVDFYHPPATLEFSLGDWEVDLDTAGQRMTARLADVEAAIQAAAEAAGRRRDEIQIVLATKTVPPERLRLAAQLGLLRFGENRAQELRNKSAVLSDLPIEWHFIGYLQRNKVKDVCPHAVLLHSLDRPQLATALDDWIAIHYEKPPAKRMAVLIEVNTSSEPSKHGVSPVLAVELARQIASLPHLTLQGLMTVASAGGSAAEVRAEFARLRHLADEIRDLGLPGVEMRHLSMGMSHDFPLAVVEGATLLRLGTAILGPRPPVV
ncbi:MAG: YggS family pyridoxal phosphate-dependent enzyme [Bacteroidota bacterium]